ncbi:MAG TPA: lytic murein transglycosylase [Pilimelia sp.]|nr:lytic murein transglycosylase [Pilimelia sp.]
MSEADTGDDRPPGSGPGRPRVRDAAPAVAPGRPAVRPGVPAADAFARPLPPPHRTPAGWLRHPGTRLAAPYLVMAAALGIALVTGGLLPRTAPAPAAQTGASPANPTPSADVPLPLPSGVTGVPSGPATGVPTPAPTVAGGGRPADALRGWAAGLGPRVQVPTVALEAYGYAELVLARTQPSCQLSWTTLAAIGQVESGHGSANGAQLGADAKALPTILGPPLNGRGGTVAIKDTDRGALDSDRVWDRAIGPMQFIPSTWQRSGVDADGDGRRDPNDLDDAALAAGRYLCGDSRDLGDIRQWWRAILSYNAVAPYAHKVYQTANDYGVRSRS